MEYIPFVLRLYKVVVEAFQPLLFSPPKTPVSHLLGGWKGFAKVFIDNHTKSMVGRVLLSILLVLTHKNSVFRKFCCQKQRK